MIKVYFESNNHADLVAIFDTEETYTLCLPHLKRRAASMGLTVTESVEDESINNLEIKKF